MLEAVRLVAFREVQWIREVERRVGTWRTGVIARTVAFSTRHYGLSLCLLTAVYLLLLVGAKRNLRRFFSKRVWWG